MELLIFQALPLQCWDYRYAWLNQDVVPISQCDPLLLDVERILCSDYLCVDPGICELTHINLGEAASTPPPPTKCFELVSVWEQRSIWTELDSDSQNIFTEGNKSDRLNPTEERPGLLVLRSSLDRPKQLGETYLKQLQAHYPAFHVGLVKTRFSLWPGTRVLHSRGLLYKHIKLFFIWDVLL